MFTDNVDQKVQQVNVQQLKDELRGHLRVLESVKQTEKRSA
jgi:hypothetical protein